MTPEQEQEWRDAKRLYFVQVGADGPIKVGITGDITRRVSNLQMGNPIGLRVRAAVKMIGADRAESFLHDFFREEHIRGEWFQPSWRLEMYIEKLNELAEEVDRENWSTP